MKIAVKKFFNSNQIGYYEIVLTLLILVAFLINATYVVYPDEFYNLMGSKFINNGHIPYKDFFDHHMPFPWYLGAILLKISVGSYVVFRHLWALLQFASLVVLGSWIRKHNKNLYPYYLTFTFLYPLMAVYFWLHIFIADALAAFIFSLIFWMLLSITFDREKKHRARPIFVTNFLTFLFIFTSLTYIYLAIILYLWEFYLILRSGKKTIAVFFILAATPYLLYGIYLLLTGSAADFYFSNFTYNTALYINIPNYTIGQHFNPVKFAATLIYNFWGQYLPQLTGLKDINLYLPVGKLTLMGSFLLLIYLLARLPIIGILYLALLSFSLPRSGIKEFNETDYQIGVFVMIGIIATLFMAYLLRRERFKEQTMNDLSRVVQAMIGVYMIFLFIFMIKGTYDKWYLRTTQKMPSIRNSADAAIFIDRILDSKDYYWIGPFEPNEEVFVHNGQLPGKFIALLPQYRENEKMRADFLNQFSTHNPKIIIFKTDTGIFGTPTYQFGSFYLDWMKDKYTRLGAIPGIQVVQNPTGLNLALHLYIKNEDKNNIIAKLQALQYISK